MDTPKSNVSLIITSLLNCHLMGVYLIVRLTHVEWHRRCLISLFPKFISSGHMMWYALMDFGFCVCWQNSGVSNASYNLTAGLARATCGHCQTGNSSGEHRCGMVRPWVHCLWLRSIFNIGAIGALMSTKSGYILASKTHTCTYTYYAHL